MHKDQIRKLILEARRSINSEQRAAKNATIQKKLLALPAFKKAEKILLYHSLEEEVSTLEIIRDFIEEKFIILPRTEENQLILHHVDALKSLQKGDFNIIEPHVENDVVDPSTVELAIIPGVAFDKKLQRIGFGRGFYDRLLKKLNCPIVALAYECQIVSSIPNEAHDEPVDIIITEKQTII